MPARALEPAGVALVDKPAGPSSFAIVAQIRRVTGARTGHASTLDPFATGLLLLLSGRATKLAPRLVGLDKRYLTTIDLTATTTTGDLICALYCQMPGSWVPGMGDVFVHVAPPSLVT